jgi:hypothetical protein
LPDAVTEIIAAKVISYGMLVFEPADGVINGRRA